MSLNDRTEAENVLLPELSASSHVPHAADGPGNSFVDISVDDKPYRIHRGRRTVAEIKVVGQVPTADELEQVLVDEVPPLRPLADDGSITIKGGEIFISHPRDSGSSPVLPRVRRWGVAR